MNDFETIWGRIKKETNLNSFSDLGKIINKTQPTISAAKAKGNFSAEWAYLVAIKFELLTEWIMTGNEPKRIKDIDSSSIKFEILKDIETWLESIIEEEPHRKEWFEIQFKDSFLGFKEWKQRKEEKEGDSSEFPNSKAV